MTEQDVEVIVQRALEKHPGSKPRIITDNGPQFVAKDFKPECLRTRSLASLEHARRRVSAYVEHDNHARLHSALGYITPADKLHGLEDVIFAERDRKLEQARLRRQPARQAVREVAS